MRAWLILSALGICSFFVVAIAFGLSAGTEVKVNTSSYLSAVFDTSPSVEILPHGALLLMLAGSLVLILLPVFYELSSGFHHESRKIEEKPNFEFSLTQNRLVDIGVSKRNLAEIGKITKDVVRDLKQIVEEKRHNK